MSSERADNDAGGHSADQALVAAVLPGAPGAFQALTARVERVVGACLAQVAMHAPWARAHRQDLLQAFWLLLVEADYRVLRSYAGQAALTTWIHVIARRFFRRQAGALRARPPEPGAPPAESDSPEAALLRQEQVAALRAATASLPDEDRLLLALIYEQELDAPTIAPALGLSPSGVRMRKQRLLAALARTLRLLGR